MRFLIFYYDGNEHTHIFTDSWEEVERFNQGDIVAVIEVPSNNAPINFWVAEGNELTYKGDTSCGI